MHQNRTENFIELTSDYVHSLTVELLIEHFDLVVCGHKFTTSDIWNVVVAASVQGQAIESTANQLEDAPDSSTVRYYLRTQLVNTMTLAAIERTCNQALVDKLPERLIGKQHQVAIDLTFIPYHGIAASDPNEICRSQAKSGTTHFHCYATAYVIKHNKRVTLAVIYVQAEETLTQVLFRLLSRLSDIQVGIKRLYLDKQFYTVEVIRWFDEQYPLMSVIIPAIIRGKQGGTRALLVGPASYLTHYTMVSPKHGKASFDVAVVRKYSKGRYSRHGVYWFIYVLLGPVRLPLHQIYDAYRRRFGIESTYRLMNQVRARTSSRRPELRLLFVGIALCLINIWVYLKWTYLGKPRQGGRNVHQSLFRLAMFRQFLLEAIKAIYGAVQSIKPPWVTLP